MAKLTSEEIRRRFEAMPDGDDSPARTTRRDIETWRNQYSDETAIVCSGPWPIFCVDAWPVSRFAWCRHCRENVPSKRR